jgi:hypothetical protein
VRSGQAPPAGLGSGISGDKFERHEGALSDSERMNMLNRELLGISQ